MRIVNPVGKKGEDIAAEYLKQKGLKILERNFRKGYGEIDIIALDSKKHLLVFVEVKTRTNNQFGTPLEAITSWKLRPLLQTAELYSTLHPELPTELRLDAVAVIVDEKLEKKEIAHIENISGF